MRDRPRRNPVILVPASNPYTEACWHPLVDVCRTRQGWLLKFELAGVRKDDVSVHIAGRRVTVSGSRRDWDLEEDVSYYSMEITYSRFERIVDLPCDLQGAQWEVEFRDGLLLVRVMPEGGEL